MPDKFRMIEYRGWFFTHTDAEMLSMRSIMGANSLVYTHDTGRLYRYTGGTSNTLADFTTVDGVRHNVRFFKTLTAYEVGRHVVHNGIIYECITAVPDTNTTTPDQDVASWSAPSGNYTVGTIKSYALGGLGKQRREITSSISDTANFIYQVYTVSANSSAAWANNTVSFSGVIYGNHLHAGDNNIYWFNNGTAPANTITANNLSTLSNTLPIWMVDSVPSGLTVTLNKKQRVTVDITTAQSGSHTIPAGSTDIEMLLIGAGGGGSWGNSSDNGNGRGGGGGEGGQITYQNIGTAWAGLTVNYTVGAGGNGAVRAGTTQSQNGQNSSVTVNGTVITSVGGDAGGTTAGSNWEGGTGGAGADGGAGGAWNGGWGNGGTAGQTFTIHGTAYSVGGGGGGGGAGSSNTGSWQGGGAGGAGGGGSGGTGQFYINNAGNGGAGTNGTGGGGGGGGGSAQAASNAHSSGGGRGGDGRFLLAYYTHTSTTANAYGTTYWSNNTSAGGLFTSTGTQIATPANINLQLANFRDVISVLAVVRGIT